VDNLAVKASNWIGLINSAKLKPGVSTVTLSRVF